MTERRALIKPPHPQLSVHRQCQLLGLPRSSFYYQPVAPDRLTLELMNAIDRIYTEHPIYGVRRIGATLRRAGYPVNPKRVHRLMKAMGLQAIYPRTRRTTPDPQHRVYPYLLRGVTVDRPDHVWCSDITYLPVGSGFVYLVAVMDWFSRYVLSGRVSNTLDAAFCVEALEEALDQGRPEIFNTDQGAQFTSAAFTGRVEAAGARVSMDGRGRVLDNIFIERLWRSLKYEDVYLKGLRHGPAADRGRGRLLHASTTTSGPTRPSTTRRPAMSTTKRPDRPQALTSAPGSRPGCKFGRRGCDASSVLEDHSPGARNSRLYQPNFCPVDGVHLNPRWNSLPSRWSISSHCAFSSRSGGSGTTSPTT